MPPKRYREGSPNTVLRSMSSEESGNSMNINLSQNTLNSRNNGYGGFSNNENGNLERTAKRRKNNSQPPPPLVTVAQAAGSKQKANYEKLRIKRNSLPRGLYNIFSNARLQNAVNQGRYQNMNTQIKSKIKLANNHERRIKNQLNKIPNGIFRRNTTFKINNVIGNNNKTNALLQQINTEQKKINANAKAAANNARRKAVANAKKKAIIARQQVSVKVSNNTANKAKANANAKAAANKAAENAKKAAANKAAENAKKAAANNARRKAVANAKKKAIIARQQVSVKVSNNTANKAKANANARAAANKANANAKAAANKANANAKARAAANKANANARAATPANSARVSATTLGTPNQSLNNNASFASIIKPANKRNSKEKPGKLMKEGILLEITKQAQRTAKMKSLNNLRKLNGILNSPNSIKEYDTYAWALLYDMVKGLYDTKFEVDGKPINVSLKTLKQIHEKLRQKNIYSSGRTTGGEGNRRRFDTETFNNDEIVEFLLLIWLDGSHDAYITSSFLAWLDSPTCKQYFNNRHRELAKSFVKDFPNPTNFKDTFKKNPKGFKIFKTGIFENIKGYDTIRKICIETEAVWFFIHDFNPGTSKRMIDKGFTDGKSPPTASLSGNFEKELKLGIKEILNTQQTNEIYSGGEISNLKRSGVKIVSLDMEADGDILSEAIRNTPSFRPFVTVASLIDPGKHMNKTSAGRKDVQLVLSAMETGKVDLLDELQCQYYIGPLNFTIMDTIKTKNGNNNNLPFFEINLSIKQGGPSITNEGRVSTSDFFDLKVNGEKVRQGATAANARNGPSKPRAKNFIIKKPEAKMGKFMGDALQYMVVAIQNKYRGRERYFASGDGSACFMYVYFCNKLNIKPKLIIDKGDERIRTIGLRNN
jgi:hypothetical protein